MSGASVKAMSRSQSVGCGTSTAGCNAPLPLSDAEFDCPPQAASIAHASSGHACAQLVSRRWIAAHAYKSRIVRKRKRPELGTASADTTKIGCAYGRIRIGTCPNGFRISRSDSLIDVQRFGTPGRVSAECAGRNRAACEETAMKAWAGLALSLWILSPEQGAAQSSFAVRVLNASPTAIAADAELARFVDQTAAAAIETHCAACHGPDLRGQPGVPDLLDYDWLWGVTGFESNAAGAVMEIQQTLLYGIRDRNCPEEQKSYGACADTRYSEMPAYAELGFDAQTLEDLAAYVLGLSGADADAAAIDRAEAFWPVCIECHAEDGYGYGYAPTAALT
jgi:mono/diheme cytochrome c family protein